MSIKNVIVAVVEFGLIIDTAVLSKSGKGVDPFAVTVEVPVLGIVFVPLSTPLLLKRALANGPVSES